MAATRGTWKTASAMLMRMPKDSRNSHGTLTRPMRREVAINSTAPISIARRIPYRSPSHPAGGPNTPEKTQRSEKARPTMLRVDHIGDEDAGRRALHRADQAHRDRDA